MMIMTQSGRFRESSIEGEICEDANKTDAEKKSGLR